MPLWFASLVLLASCNALDPSTGLGDRSFLLESAEGFDVVPGTTIRLNFENGNVGFYAGCNQFSAPYSLCGGALCLGEGPGSTAIGCAAALQTQDEEFLALLTSRPFLELDGDRLTLRNDPTQRPDPAFALVFLDREVADPDRPLQGGTWTIDTLIHRGTASSGAVASTTNDLDQGTLTFGSDGVIDVQTGCNAGEGGFVIGGGSGAGTEITLDHMAYTEEACDGATGPDLVRDVMSDGVVTFVIDAARLTITRGDIGLGATTECDGS